MFRASILRVNLFIFDINPISPVVFYTHQTPNARRVANSRNSGTTAVGSGSRVNGDCARVFEIQHHDS